MIEKILPDAVACSEVFDDLPDAVLFPEEEVISRAVEKRRRESGALRGHLIRSARASPPRPKKSTSLELVT